MRNAEWGTAPGLRAIPKRRRRRCSAGAVQNAGGPVGVQSRPNKSDPVAPGRTKNQSGSHRIKVDPSERSKMFGSNADIFIRKLTELCGMSKSLKKCPRQSYCHWNLAALRGEAAVGQAGAIRKLRLLSFTGAIQP